MNEVYLAVGAIRLKYQGGRSIQQIISEIAHMDFGYVSKCFERIENSKKGIVEALKEAQMKETDKYLNFLLYNFLISYSQNINLITALDEIEEKIMLDEKKYTDDFILHTNKVTFTMLYVSFLPFLYIMVEIVDWTFKEYMEKSFLTDQMRIGFFVFCIFIFIIMMMRYSLLRTGAGD